MAAITGDFDFWNMSSKESMLNVWLNIGNGKTISVTVAVLATILSPIIVFGNSLVILSIWKDPLKKLRSSPSNFIILSMAIADLLVGLVACPTTVYWSWAVFCQQWAFGPLKFFSVLINVSVGHVFLLSIDRFIALVTPFQYRVKVTNKRVCITIATCWSYFLLFGLVFVLGQNLFAIMGTVYNVQIFSLLICILVFNLATVIRFHKHLQTNKALEGQSATRHQLMLQRERTFSKAIAIIICAFLICSMPWFIMQILIYVCIPCSRNLSSLMLVYAITALLLGANSAVNPCIYAWRLPKFRETLKHLFNKRKCCHGIENGNIENCVHDTRL